MNITFGDPEREHVSLEVDGYLLPDTCGDYLEDNWLSVDVSAVAGSFRGSGQGLVLTSELSGFSEQLHALYEKLTGCAEFKPMDTPLWLKLEGDGRGHIQLEGEVDECKARPSRVSFSVSFDQTELRAHLATLDSIIRAFPVRGAG